MSFSPNLGNHDLEPQMSIHDAAHAYRPRFVLGSLIAILLFIGCVLFVPAFFMPYPPETVVNYLTFSLQAIQYLADGVIGMIAGEVTGRLYTFIVSAYISAYEGFGQVLGAAFIIAWVAFILKNRARRRAHIARVLAQDEVRQPLLRQATAGFTAKDDITNPDHLAQLLQSPEWDSAKRKASRVKSQDKSKVVRRAVIGLCFFAVVVIASVVFIPIEFLFFLAPLIVLFGLYIVYAKATNIQFVYDRFFLENIASLPGAPLGVIDLISVTRRDVSTIKSRSNRTITTLIAQRRTATNTDDNILTGPNYEAGIGYIIDYDRGRKRHLFTFKTANATVTASDIFLTHGESAFGSRDTMVRTTTMVGYIYEVKLKKPLDVSCTIRIDSLEGDRLKHVLACVHWPELTHEFSTPELNALFSCVMYPAGSPAVPFAGDEAAIAVAAAKAIITPQFEEMLAFIRTKYGPFTLLIANGQLQIQVLEWVQGDAVYHDIVTTGNLTEQTLRNRHRRKYLGNLFTTSLRNGNDLADQRVTRIYDAYLLGCVLGVIGS